MPAEVPAQWPSVAAHTVAQPPGAFVPPSPSPFYGPPFLGPGWGQFASPAMGQAMGHPYLTRISLVSRSYLKPYLTPMPCAPSMKTGAPASPAIPYHTCTIPQLARILHRTCILHRTLRVHRISTVSHTVPDALLSVDCDALPRWALFSLHGAFGACGPTLRPAHALWPPRHVHGRHGRGCIHDASVVAADASAVAAGAA